MKTRLFLLLLISLFVLQVVIGNSRYDDSVMAEYKTCVNDEQLAGLAPVAVDDFYTIRQGSSLNVPNIGSTDARILDNDWDPDGDDIVLNMSAPTTMASVINANNTLIIFTDGSIQYTPDDSFVGTDYFDYEICDDGIPRQCATGTIFITVEHCVDIRLSVYLEGGYNLGMGEMNTFLNLLSGNPLHRGVLPGQKSFNIFASGTAPYQPYDIAPWSYNGLEGTMDSAPWYYAPGSTDPMGDPNYAVYHPDVVDWVLVRFKTGVPYSTMVTVKTAAALLFKDGQIRFLEPCILNQDVVAGNLVYVQIDHRNHMAVMTADPINISSGTLYYDFRIQQSYKTSVSFGQKELVPGTFVMYAGDSDQASDFPSYDINGFDNILWSASNGNFDQYLSADYDLNADANSLDKIIWSKNSGIASRVPK